MGHYEKCQKKGKIRSFKVGKIYRFKKSELEEDLRTGKHEVATR